jgi:Zn-dependent M28 family amino/carboxypeptidase
MLFRRVTQCALAGLLFSCTTTRESTYDREDGLASISASEMKAYVKELASDEFEGRKPFTRGEEKTIAFLEKTFRDLGLEPGNGDSYLQEVPMVEITATNEGTMKVAGPKTNLTLKGFDEYVLNTERTDESIVWNAEEMVFAGFGIVAPEYNWNDYEGLDVKDKIVIVLVNDPGFGGTDTAHFKGNTMTYYGRWTYKYEEAARQGAKGCFVVHNTVPAGYPFGVLQNSWNSAHLYLDQRGKDNYYCEGIGWLTKDATEKLFKAAGFDFNEHQTKARQPGYKGFLLNLKASTSMTVTSRYNKSHNVIAKVAGSVRPDEYIVYTAHWDHLGIGRPDAEGDTIYNGAYDNASGTAGLLEIAEAFASLQTRPERTVVFLAVTAEEQGLWGSAYYAENPIYAKEKTVANINMDGINQFGKTSDIVIIGKGQSELEDYLLEEARQFGRTVLPDSESEKGFYFRSDHFNFAKIGVPALYLKTGSDFGDASAAREFKESYTNRYYHQPSDAYYEDKLNYEGGVEDLKLLFLVGKKLAFENSWPNWKAGSEFKATRDSYKK